MSDQETNGEDSGGIFCKTCSPAQRKWGYYITFIFGAVVFAFGVINILSKQNVYLIAGSSIILLCPLWVKSCSGCVGDMKNALRLTSTLIFFIFLVANIVFFVLGVEPGILTFVLGVCLGVSGIWYFLSFIPNGQQACLACLKSCCSSDSGSA